MSTEFTRVDDKLDRIQRMVFESNKTNTASLKTLENSATSRLECTTSLVSTIAAGQADLHTQLNTIHNNIAIMNNANITLSNTLHNKI